MSQSATITDLRYSESLEFLYRRINYERSPDAAGSLQDFKLARMERLLSLLGNPQDRIPVAHITGTKGKGSTATMVARIAEAAGYRVGLFTSPHAHRFEERMTVNGVLPSPQTTIELVDRLRPVVGQLDRESLSPTFFELATALGWLHFLNEQVDLAVLEVGLGGRLDSTNVCRPLATAITSISYDHTRLLGNTLESIAAEKAGIIKSGIPMVSGVTDPGPAGVIEDIARTKGAPLLKVDRDFSGEILRSTETDGSLPPCPTLDVRVRDLWIRDLRLVMPGAHQARNAAIAATVSLLLKPSFPGFTDASIRRGLLNARCPLRVEAIASRPLVILDVAHNPASIQALCETLASVTAERRVAVFASSRDKETSENLRRLGESFDEIILTRFLSNPRSMTEQELVSIARDVLKCPWTWAETPERASELARSRVSPDGLICFTGSFFLAAEVQEFESRFPAGVPAG